MKRAVFFIYIFISTVLILSSHPTASDFPKLSGPYLGQKPPGITPELFAPGIVSTKAKEVLIGFFHNGTMCLFERCDSNFKQDWIFIPIYITKLNETEWTKPEVVVLPGNPWYFSYLDTPLGTVVFFAWRKNIDGSGSVSDIDIWKTTYESTGWSTPINLGSPVNTDRIDSWPSLSKTQTLYFFSTRTSGFGKADLYCSFSNNGNYSEAENLGQNINTKYNDHDPFIAPDEKYLIWCSDRPDGYGDNDLYISYKKSDGSWTQSINMGNLINSERAETQPYITSDGKYLFFNRTQDNNRDVYWVDAKIIEELKAKK